MRSSGSLVDLPARSTPHAVGRSFVIASVVVAMEIRILVSPSRSVDSSARDPAVENLVPSRNRESSAPGEEIVPLTRPQTAS